MADIEVKLKLRGVNEVMASKGVQDEVNRRGARIAAAAGKKYRLVVHPHKWTARAYVAPADGASITDTDANGLLRALDAARGS